MIYRLLLFLLALLSASTGFSQPKYYGFQFVGKNKRSVIPIEVYNNLVVVPVVLNNSIPLRFIVDTGVRTAILTERTFADILNLEYSRKYSIAAPGTDRRIEAFVTNDVSLTLTGLTGEGHAMLVLQDDYLELRNYLGVDVHGILGYELFSRFIVDIDYARRTMTLEKPETWRKSRSLIELDMKVIDTKPYVTIPVTLSNGVQFMARLLVDSGASHGILLDPNASDTITVPVNSLPCVIGRGLGGDITGRVGKITSLQLTKVPLLQVITNFPDAYNYNDSIKGTKTFRHGTIGGEILSRYRTVYNFSKEKLYLSKKVQVKRPFYFNLSGITIKAKGARLNVFEIIDVLPNSPGERAGIKSGDIIIKLNGMASQYQELKTINNQLNSKPGKKIRMEVSRSRTVRKVEFELADPLQ